MDSNPTGSGNDERPVGVPGDSIPPPPEPTSAPGGWPPPSPPQVPPPGGQPPLAPETIRRYVTLQTLTLLGCWGWFAALWTVAFFNYTLEDFEWWLLVAAACAGLYGLRPNLERAIDTATLQGTNNSKILAERVAQLRPIKRRIDVIFSVGVLVIFIMAGLLWFALEMVGLMEGGPGA